MLSMISHYKLHLLQDSTQPSVKHVIMFQLITKRMQVGKFTLPSELVFDGGPLSPLVHTICSNINWLQSCLVINNWCY